MISPNLFLRWLSVLAPIILAKCCAQDFDSSTSTPNDTTLDADARRLLEVLPDSTTTGKYGPDAVPVGNYTLLGCGSGAAGSKADHLLTILPTMLNRLNYAIAEAALGIAGFHGYKTFFKDEGLEPAVMKTLRDIQVGSTITLRTRRGDRVETPKIACLGEDADEGHVTGVGNLYKHFCNATSGVNSTAAQFRKTELVVLCPDFFKLTIWPSVTGCPRTVNQESKLDGVRLVQSQYTMLMRALAGVYIPTNRQTVVPARPDVPASVGTVAALPAGVAVGSKDSYAYFIGCESYLPFLEGVKKKSSADNN